MSCDLYSTHQTANNAKNIYVNTKTNPFFPPFLLFFRTTKGRKCSLPVYAEEDGNDFSDLGIGTSSASGKSSLSEDFDNHSVIVSSNNIQLIYLFQIS